MHDSDTTNTSTSSTSVSSTSPPPPPNKSTHSIITRARAGIFKPKTFVSSTLVPILEPDDVEQALLDPYWKKAMIEEYDALVRNNTWELVPWSSDMNLITTKWVFRVKYKADGSVDRYKARLMARGFQQNAGVDYFQTFSPVIKPLTLRIMFIIAATKG